MTSATYRTPHQTAQLGFRALVERLGPGGAIEFMHQYEQGEGDYTQERKAILKTFRLEDLVRSARKRRPAALGVTEQRPAMALPAGSRRARPSPAS